MLELVASLCLTVSAPHDAPVLVLPAFERVLVDEDDRDDDDTPGTVVTLTSLPPLPETKGTTAPCHDARTPLRSAASPRGPPTNRA